MTIGLRLNNPGNLRVSPNHWLGKLTPSRDPAFETFDTMEHGIRAMALLIINYYRGHDLKSIHGVVNRYAPPSENPTDAYAANVSDYTGFDVDADLNLVSKDDLLPIIKGMCHQEQGAAIRVVTDEQFESGVNMALATIVSA